MPTWFYFLRPRNQASHNLTRRRKPTPNWRSLLGLGLNFCPRLRYTTFDLASTEKRFRRDMYNKAIYADGQRDEEFDRILYLWSNRAVQTKDIPPGLPRQLTEFFAELKKLFKKKSSPSNLLPSQRNCLQALKDSETLVVLATDKNLGPAITDKRRYVQMAFNDHLRDGTAYSKIS